MVRRVLRTLEFQWWLLPLLFLPGRDAFAVEIAAWEDPSRTATILQARQASQNAEFEALDSNRFRVTMSASAWWLRVTPSHEEEAGPWVLAMDGSPVHDVQVFVPQGDAWRQFTTGDQRPFSTRPIPDPGFVFPIAAAGESLPENVFVRLASEGSLAMRVRVLPREKYRDEQVRSQFLFGAYYAFVGALVLYNGFLFLAVRDPAYLGYVLYLGFILLFNAARTGHASMWLWPEAPWWALRTGVAVVPVAMTGILMMAWQLCEARSQPQWIRAGFWAFPIVGLAIAALLFVDYTAGIAVVTSYVAASCAFVAVSLAIGLRRKVRTARYVLIGWLLVVPTVLVWIANYRGWVDAGFWGEHALKISVAVEALFFSFALAARIRIVEQNRRQAEARLMRNQRLLSQRLLGAQDEERKRIARQLHDGLGQPLLVLSNRLERRFSGESRATDLIALARGALDDVRSLSRGLHPHRLDLLGFPEAVRELVCQALEPEGVSIEVNLPDEVELSSAQGLHFYRIIQEAVANVVRHAKATKLHVELRVSETELLLRVEDDGIGRAEGLVADGLGLASIFERARSLGGEARYTSVKPRGLRLDIVVPR